MYRYKFLSFSILLVIFCSNVNIFAETLYEIEPFKMNKKEPKSKNIPSTDDIRIINIREDIQKEKSHFVLGVQGGYLLMFSFIKNQSRFWIPYLSVTTKINFIEFELGYFGIKSSKNMLPNEHVSHGFPLIVSMVLDLKLTKSIFFSPKLGLGGMFMLTYSNYRDTNYSSFAVLKPGLDFSFGLTDNFFIDIRNSFLIAQDLNKKFNKKVQYYYISGLGISYKF